MHASVFLLLAAKGDPVLTPRKFGKTPNLPLFIVRYVVNGQRGAGAIGLRVALDWQSVDYGGREFMPGRLIDAENWQRAVGADLQWMSDFDNAEGINYSTPMAISTDRRWRNGLFTLAFVARLIVVCWQPRIARRAVLCVAQASGYRLTPHMVLAANIRLASGRPISSRRAYWPRQRQVEVAFTAPPATPAAEIIDRSPAAYPVSAMPINVNGRIATALPLRLALP